MILLGLGSNVGDRKEHIFAAVHRLSAHPRIRVIKVSSLYETEPYGLKEQAAFINAAAEIETDLSPLELLDVCQQIERDLGRKRVVRWGPRTIDIDLLVFNEMEMDTERLTLPHRYLPERRFVLVPVAEITREALGRQGTAIALLKRCPDSGTVDFYESFPDDKEPIHEKPCENFIAERSHRSGARESR